jgi:hypothetical protein
MSTGLTYAIAGLIAFMAFAAQTAAASGMIMA